MAHDLEIGKELIQPYEIINWVKEGNKYKKITQKIKAKYLLQEVTNGA